MAGRRPERRLATVFFLDIVDSTRIAGEVGDRRWRDMVREFRRIVRRQLRAHRGHEEDTAGDGFFATFTRPASAVHAGTRIVVAVQRLGIDVRCGIHTGELERIDGRLGGIAAHIGARVMGHATAAEVLVTGTVHDLVVGSGISFSPPAETELKGVPGRWALYTVEKVEGIALPAPLGPEAERPQLGRQGRESAVSAPVLVLAAFTVLLAAAMGVYALVPRADPSAGALSSPTNEPDAITMLRIDPETSEIVDQIRDDYLSVYRPSPLTVVDGTLWQETPINLVRRNLATGAVEATIDLPPNTWAVHFGFGSIWFVRYDGVSTNFIERVDPVSGVVIATIELERGTVQASTIGRGGIWLLKGRDLLEVSPTLNALVDTDMIEAATVPNGMTSVGDLLWICECSEGRLIHYDPDADVALGPPVEFAQRGIVLPDYRIASQGAVSIDEQTMWLLDASGATVTPLDAAAGEPAGQPMGIPPAVSGHTFGFGSLWLAAGASVHRIELESREITGIRMPEGVLGRGIALDEPTGAVWVSNCGEGYIMFRPGCEE